MRPQPVPTPVLARAGSPLVVRPVAGAQLTLPQYQWVARMCSAEQAQSWQVAWAAWAARAVQPAWRFPHGRS